jgi:formamidopyrimidine-DNA glycosylase
MPELPEVQTIVDTLRPRVLKQTITAVRLNRADILRPAGFNLPVHLLGRTISDIHRRGKKIILQLDDGNRFYIHLGMTGRLSVESPSTELLTHTHLILELGPIQIRFRDPRRFGGIWWLGTDESPDENLGPEPLDIRPQQLAQRLAKTTRAIKNALLDQTVLAGLGNIYVDESLFRAGIHPLTPANALSADQINRLDRAIKFVLRQAIRHRGSTLRDYFDANGESGGFQKLHAVYDRTGQKCRRCPAIIQRIVLGGRSTHFCPRCQARRVSSPRPPRHED